MKAAMKAPEQQSILARGSAGHSDGSEEAAAEELVQLAVRSEALAAQEAQLAALSDQLAAAEQALLALQRQQGTDLLTASVPSAASHDATLAARWACLAAQRQELAARWQCLAEEKKQLTLLLQQAARRSGGGDSGFEPGQFPVRDVRCAIISHQVDIPCGSCCFQR